MKLEVGATYCISSQAPQVLSNRGLSSGSEWRITWLTDDLVSLSHIRGNGLGWGKITVVRAVFGQNFSLIQASTPDLKANYGEGMHFYPDARFSGSAILPI